MPSLRSELAEISKRQDSWFGSTARKRTRSTASETRRDRDKEPAEAAPVRKRRIKSDEVVNIPTNSPDLANVEDKIGNKSENGIVVAAAADPNVSADWVDSDYLEFLQNLDAIQPEPEPNKEDDEDMVDPDYKLFLENAKQFGHSYVFEMKNADGSNVLIKYEEDIKKKKNTNVGTLRKQRKQIVNNPKQQHQQSRGVKLNVETLRRKKNPVVDTPGEQNEKNLVVKQNVDAMGLRIPKTEQPDDDELGRSTSKGHWFLSDCKPEAIANADESYLKFLQHLWVTDGSLLYEHGDMVVKYEDYNEGVGTDCEQTGRRDGTCDNEKSLTPYPNQPTHLDEEDSDGVHILDDNSVKLHYKEKLNMKLREALQIPFNENELEEKLMEARDRKPLERTRIMRGRAVSYPTNRTSSSYLDLHPDLAGMLRSADPERSLALLRCLFFYYENVSHQGSFIPWRNPEGWLHEMICSCGENLNCPMKHNQSMEKEVWAEE